MTDTKTDKEQLLKIADWFARDHFAQPSNTWCMEQAETLRRIAANLPEEELQQIGVAWVRSDGVEFAVWEFNPTKVCQESLGLKPVPVYIAVRPK